MKKTIGFYDESPGPGGTTRYLYSLISGLSRAEFDLVLFGLRPRAWHEEFRVLGVEIVTLLPAPETPASPGVPPNSPAGKRPVRIPRTIAWWLGLLRETMQLKRLFAKHRVDLLHSNNAGAEPAPIAARLAGIPVVIATWHVDSTYDLEGTRSGARYRLLEIACMRSLHHAISVSRATAADWMKRCHLPASWWAKVTVIHNGVDAARLRRRRSIAEAQASAGLTDRLVVGSAGRLEPAKGYEYLIRAMPAIIVKYPQTLVRIAGRGELQASLEELARSLGVQKNLEFTGFVTDMQGFLETLDIYVQPSLCEALPMAVLEACAVGMPVIASDVGGVAECVDHGQTGFVVPPRRPDALGEFIMKLERDPLLRETMARESRRTVAEQFRCEEMASETAAVYRQLLTGIVAARVAAANLKRQPEKE